MNAANDLFLLMLNLAQMRSKSSILELFIGGMHTLFPLHTLRYADHEQLGASLNHAIATRNSTYGYIALQESEELSEENKTLLHNAVQMLAIILERLEFEKQLEEDNVNVTQLADERLKKLLVTVDELRESRKASLDLIEKLTNEIAVRQHTEEALRESEEKHRTILQTAMDGFWVVDAAGCLLEVNETYCRMSGYSKQELLAMSVADLEVVETSTDTTAHIRKTMTLGEDRFQSRHRRKDGSCFDVEVSVQYRPIDGGRFLTFVQDITERKHADEQQRRSLEEKEVLLREVHHRVKNNLNVIYSLLNLQSSAIHAPEQAMEAFQNSRDRIMAMALVHKELYESRNYARIDMGAYLEGLTRHLLQAYGSGGNIRLSVQAEGIVLNVSTSIPCGLILNELITNAFKHAFLDGGAGEIRIVFGMVGSDFLKLCVSDNGIGLPKGSEGGGTLGLTLVRLLTEQLEGTMEIATEHGTCFCIRFPRGQRNE